MSTLAKTQADQEAQPASNAWRRFTVSGEASGTVRAIFSVPGMHCAGCISKIENDLDRLRGIHQARANLTTRRVVVEFDPLTQTIATLGQAIEKSGFEAAPFDPRLVAAADEADEKGLLRAMAVAGFAAANIMLLSVGVWAGLDSDMAFETRQLFHWISALIAMPAVAYAGRPFFRSAMSVLRLAKMNMDVPISLAVLLATGASLLETIRGAEHVYFDASVTLLFFLLIGRYLDHRMRTRAGNAAQNLLALQATAASLIRADGTRQSISVDDLCPGMLLYVAPGMRIPADGRVIGGRSDIDMSLLNGESSPATVGPGDKVLAGTLNLSGPLTLQVEEARDDTVLAEIARLVEVAEQGRSRYVRIADRAARVYAPAVHVLAIAAFAGWMIAGAGWHASLMIAIAVLIITCPCALGLAVPVVQVVAAGRLLKQGSLVRSADGLERLAGVDTIVFDKTGTLTTGEPVLLNRDAIDPHLLTQAAGLAACSTHPLARALADASEGADTAGLADVKEEPGEGLEAVADGIKMRLGRSEWVGATEDLEIRNESQLWFRRGQDRPVCFGFADQLRPEAKETVGRLKRMGYRLMLLSGDRETVTRSVAEDLGIDHWRAKCRPGDKIEALAQLSDDGASTLMVGDGLNDAPALRKADVSISPAKAADISQIASDFIFQDDNLSAIVEIIDVARRSRRLVFQNFMLALAYNAVAVPLAVAGMVTPLVAAIAMSSSSLLVTGNALRLANVRAGR